MAYRLVTNLVTRRGCNHGRGHVSVLSVVAVISLLKRKGWRERKGVNKQSSRLRIIMLLHVFNVNI